MPFTVLKELSRLETVYIHVPVAAVDSSGVVYDPTGDAVSLTVYTDETLPDSPTWHVGDWVSDSDGNHYARILVGPAGVVTLTEGSWWAFAKVTDNPEIPILRASKGFRVR